MLTFVTHCLVLSKNSFSICVQSTVYTYPIATQQPFHFSNAESRHSMSRTFMPPYFVLKILTPWGFQRRDDRRTETKTFLVPQNFSYVLF